MPSFDEMFIASKGKSIKYKGQSLVLADLFPVKNEERLKIVIESVESEWIQGLSLRTDGFFVINKQRFKGEIVCWENTAPKEFELKVLTKNKIIEITNVWDVGRGSMDYWHNGAAMIIEELENGRRYLCNDGHPDENFSDIIFRIERISC